MFEFEAEQRIFRLGDVEIGGRPGEFPVVLIGSIFHEGHGIVEDRSVGRFDEVKARKLILRQEKASRKTGIPCMLDVVGETPEAMERNLSRSSSGVRGSSASCRTRSLKLSQVSSRFR